MPTSPVPTSWTPRARAWRHAPVLALACALAFGVACATGPLPSRGTAPLVALRPPPAGGASVPAAAVPSSRAALPQASPTPLLELEPPEDPRLAIAREVLEREAAQRLGPLEREGVARVLVDADREHGLPVLLLVALIRQESRFDPRARGPRGSLGLMQVKPSVAQAIAGRLGVPWRGRETLFDPVANVRLGTGYLAHQLQRFEAVDLALAAYNMGPTRLQRRLGAGTHRKPRYVHHVLQHYHELRVAHGEPLIGVGG